MRIAAELLIAGVAFQKDGKLWEVFSHNGEYLGEMSHHMVNTTIHVLKKMGLRRERITSLTRGEMDSVTFGHYYPNQEELEQMMTRRERKPVSIH